MLDDLKRKTRDIAAGYVEEFDPSTINILITAALDNAALKARVAKLEGADAARDVVAERERQKSVEGWTSEHDDAHRLGELAGAAAAYALVRSHVETTVIMGENMIETLWPWEAKWWKPKNARYDLVRAGALILAEIERLDRANIKGADNAE